MKTKILFILIFFAVALKAGEIVTQMQPLEEVFVKKEVKYELEPIVVKALRYEGVAENYPGSVRVITKEEIEKIPAKDISDLLRTISGFEIYKRSENDFDIDIRGFNNGGGNGERILLLLNGVPIKNSDNGRVDWEFIEISEIEKIEIVKGGLGTLYGTEGALAGVINIITTEKPIKNYSLVKLNYGSFNKLGTYLSLNENLKDGFYNLKVNYKKSDSYRKNNSSEFKNLKFSISHNLKENTEIVGGYNYTESYYQFPGALTETEIYFYGAEYSKEKTSKNYKLYSLNLGLVHSLPNLKISFDLENKNRNYEYLEWQSKYDDKLWLFNIKLIKDYKILEAENRLFTGFDLKREDIKASFKDSKLESKIAGGYIQNNSVIAKEIIFQAGYRFEFVENLFSNTLKTNKKIYKLDYSQIGLLFKLPFKNDIYFNWSKNFRIPTRDEIFNFFTGDLYILEPELANNYEIGLKNANFDWLNFRTSLFYIIVKNEILGNSLWMTQPNKNIEEVIHKGAEIELTISPVKFIELKNSYTYQNIYFSKGEYKGKTVPLSPRNLDSLSLNIYPLKNFSISHISYYRDVCYFANDLNNEYKKLKSFIVTDLKLMFKKELIKFEFNIYNLYDRRYSEYGGVGFDWINFVNYLGYYPMASRHYEASVTFYF
jgi:outer membrane receptor protein involved in Fe transport